MSEHIRDGSQVFLLSSHSTVGCLVKQGKPGGGSRSEGKMSSVLDVLTTMTVFWLQRFRTVRCGQRRRYKSRYCHCIAD